MIFGWVTVQAQPSITAVNDTLYIEFECRADSVELEFIGGGFRLAMKLGIERLYCVDDPGRHYEDIVKLFNNNNNTSEYKNFMDYFYENPASMLATPNEDVFITEGILAALIRANSPEILKKNWVTI